MRIHITKHALEQMIEYEFEKSSQVAKTITKWFKEGRFCTTRNLSGNQNYEMSAINYGSGTGLIDNGANRNIALINFHIGDYQVHNKRKSEAKKVKIGNFWWVKKYMTEKL